MIRVSIIADTLTRARTVANLLAEDERLEVVDARAVSHDSRHAAAFADVIVAFGVAPGQLPEESNVVFLTDESEPLLPGRNARAWLPAQTSPAELAAAVIAAASDLTVLTPGQAKRWLPRDGSGTNQRDGVVEALTAREMQVLRMLANGLGNKEIAGQLGISGHTAKFHVAQILAKLNAGSRTEAVAIAIRRGLVPV